MKVSELDFALPERLIAQEPAPQRDASRLLVVDRASGRFTDSTFADLPSWLRSGDCLVMNDTRVIRARISARKPTGGRVEIFLLRELSAGTWKALLRPSAKVKAGTSLIIGDDLRAKAGPADASGQREVTFDREDVLSVLEDIGEVPLPPYIHRDTPHPADATRYQTIIADRPGAVAAPTAGLHYTPELLDALAAAGVARATITLHVGYGTFKPVVVEDLDDHRVDAEDFWVSEKAARTITAARAQRGRVVAVGTTTTRVLESQWGDGALLPGEGATDLCIVPGYGFRAIDVLQTNFHLPRSSLLALVAAFAGSELILAAYNHAIDQEYRFYSYGDTMLIL